MATVIALGEMAGVIALALGEMAAVIALMVGVIELAKRRRDRRRDRRQIRQQISACFLNLASSMGELMGVRR
jgi:hypothetical protein